ncbi:MAG: 16S rRNA (cytosine(1402)-N(4))-methyltransferase RsmH [Deltaproteobacteria bacterium]|nr:MAG: 16S rRNA (cytosine(1402)-N(4))-methyltransferase RsmH [Deltaproteobacteria bacterium]
MSAHVSVLVREVIECLRPGPGKRYFDGTVGGGGHAEQILIESSPDGQVLAVDRDDTALGETQKRLGRFEGRVIARQASFADAKDILTEIGWNGVDGVILDLGMSSDQIDSPERGFSFRAAARLDMRMDRRQTVDARQIVNSFALEQLERIFRVYGEEPRARRIAQAIVAGRKQHTLETTAQLVQIIERIKGRGRRDHHPATQVFQALRIAVNQELQQLEQFLESGYETLRPGGRMVIISFHSLEDRIVKAAFRKWNRACLCPPRALSCRCGWSQKVKLLTKKPIMPSASEIHANPRARSAKMRAVERM